MSGSGTLILFVAAAGIFLLLLLALVIFVVQYQKRVMHQNATIQKQALKHQEVLLKATLNSQEKERARIARNLHDGLGAALSALRLQLLLHAEEKKEDEDFLEEVADNLSGCIQNVRAISHDLLPSTLKSYGLQAAWKELFKSLNQSNAVQAQLEVVGTPTFMDDERSLNLFRVTQELVNNSLKHGQVKTIRLTVEWQAETLLVSYTDDGIGFDKQVVQKGLGMYNLQSRAPSPKCQTCHQFSPRKGLSNHLNSST